MHFSKSKLSSTFQALSLVVIAGTSVSCSEAEVAKTEVKQEPAAVQAEVMQVAATVPQLSVQLWSIKDAMTADFEGTLTKLAAMGFQGVEFAGIFGRFEQNPEGLKVFLKSLGLKRLIVII